MRDCWVEIVWPIDVDGPCPWLDLELKVLHLPAWRKCSFESRLELRWMGSVVGDSCAPNCPKENEQTSIGRQFACSCIVHRGTNILGLNQYRRRPTGVTSMNTQNKARAARISVQSVAAIHRKHLKIHILTSLSHLTFALAQLLQAINIRPLASIKRFNQ